MCSWKGTCFMFQAFDCLLWRCRAMIREDMAYAAPWAREKEGSTLLLPWQQLRNYSLILRVPL